MTIKELTNKELLPYYLEYMRRWRKKNKEKVSIINKRYKDKKKEDNILLKEDNISNMEDNILNEKDKKIISYNEDSLNIFK